MPIRLDSTFRTPVRFDSDAAGRQMDPKQIMERLQQEWAHSWSQLQKALAVLGGGKVHPWRHLTSGLTKPPTMWPKLQTQLLTNLLCFRANYAQILVAWNLICAVRHPLRIMWLLPLGAGSFHLLLVRRSVVNVPLGTDGRVFTLMHRQLHIAVAVTSLLWLLLTGTTFLLLSIVVPPVLMVLGHASACPPVGDLGALRNEIRHGLARAFRHKDADTEEMEGGSAEVNASRDADLAERVEQIRQKYRPPKANKLNKE